MSTCHSKKKKECPSGRCALRSAYLSLAPTMFGHNRPREAPSTSLRPPSNPFFQWQPSEPSPWPPSASRTSQHPILSLAPYHGSTLSPDIRQQCAPRGRPASTAGSACIFRPPTPTCLRASISTGTMWLWKVWDVSSASWLRTSAGRPASLEDAKPARRPRPPARRAEAFPR